MAEVTPPRVSVLIAAWNAESFIETALDTVARQTLAEAEVIVIDDASQDATAERVKQRALHDARIRLVEAPSNEGPGAARARGLKAATGDWVAILDADDRMEPDRLERMIAEAEHHELDAIADNLLLVDPGTEAVVGRAFPLDAGTHLDLDPNTFLDNVRPAAHVNLGWMKPVVRRDFLVRNRIEWPPIRHAEDMVFTMRLLCAGARLRLIGEAGYRYTQRVGTASGQRSALSRTRRSISEQQRALDLILTECATLDPGARRRLRRMRGEITATTHALSMRDALADGAYASAVRQGLAALARPAALSRCLRARYAVGRRFNSATLPTRTGSRGG